jgi:hypothetical protein
MRSSFAPHESAPDTDPDSSFWRSSPAIRFASDPFGEPCPHLATEVRSRWTSANLYLLFLCAYDELNLKPDPTPWEETNELWKWDVAEAFLGSDVTNINHYKEFEVSPQGEWIDLSIDLDLPKHEKGWLWSSRFESAARIDANHKLWYAFMRIPYAAIDHRPAAVGNTLRANFSRIQGPSGSLVIWQPTMSPTFHVPTAFGSLTLESS